MSADGLGSLYQEVILDHARQRHGDGHGEAPAAASHQLNPSCGDEITLRVHLMRGDGTRRIAELGGPGLRHLAGFGIHARTTWSTA